MGSKHIMQRTHRVLGTLLSLVFLMWFCSGLVMIYHTYPSVQRRQIISTSSAIDTAGLLPMQALTAALPGGSDSVCGLVLESRAGVPRLRVTNPSCERVLNAREGSVMNRFTSDQLLAEALKWNPHGARLTDTLNAIDVWLIGAAPFKEFPVYRYALDNEDEAEVYLSSRTADAVQFTTASSRFWAWVGAIPHWIYIKQLRAHGRQPWTDVVLWVSGFGTLMIVAGLVRGWRACRRAHGDVSSYKKGMFRWHHILGGLFGLFVLTWVFSGYMSLAKVPRWLVPVYEERSVQEEIAGGAVLPIADYALDYRCVLASDRVKSLSWVALGGLPAYKVETVGETYLVDARKVDRLERLRIDEDYCYNLMRRVRGEHTQVAVELLERYDNYYVSQRNQLPLPVYKIRVDDADNSCYYLNPSDGSCRYYNDNTRTRAWLYGGLHCFRMSYFAQHPVLRVVLEWVLMLGGCAVSLTGVVLAARSLRRCVLRLKNGSAR